MFIRREQRQHGKPIGRGWLRRSSNHLTEETSNSPVAPKETKSLEEITGFHFLSLHESLQTKSEIFAPKIEPGRAGRKIKLVANYFEVEMPHGNVYHYDIQICTVKSRIQQSMDSGKKYRCMNTLHNRKIMNEIMKSNAVFHGIYPVYDGRKNLITRYPLNKEYLTMPVTMTRNDGSEELYEVVIKPAIKPCSKDCSINLEPLHELYAGRTKFISQEAVMALEIILRQNPTLRFVPIGRSFFSPPTGEALSIGSGREVWFGFHQSLHINKWKPMLNIDMSATTFHESGSVLTLASKLLRVDPEKLKQIKKMQKCDIRCLTRELSGVMIEVCHMAYPRKYRVVRVTEESSSQLTFPFNVNGKTIRKSIADYFGERYKRRLEFPNLPCLQVGRLEKKTYLPMEVCKIVKGQHCTKKLNDEQTAEMIKHTAIPPDKRFQEIRNVMQNCSFSEDLYLNFFDIKVNTHPLQLTGRVIDPPTVCYNNQRTVVPRDGAWKMEENSFLDPVAINNWVLISFSSSKFCNRQALHKCAEMICQVGKSYGMTIGSPTLIATFEDNYDVLQILEEMVFEHDASLAVVVITSRTSCYSEVKQAAETQLGLVTQCILDINVVKKCNTSLISNLLQKINIKMGGINNSLLKAQRPVIFNRPVIIIAADVSHPAPGDKIKPSIAAAVGSLDALPSRYAVSIRLQARQNEVQEGVEIIVELKEIVKDLLRVFYKTSNRKPEQIIFLRDGVSEGEFPVVVREELGQIRKACLELQADYNPGITFTVVQKNHHIRFKPFNSSDGVGKMRNIPPGTTVDQSVVSAVYFDFFLCSQFGLQGTSKPAHYTVLWDDNDFTSDELQKLLYYLCYTYARCTRSISIPAPIKYAHLAANRARNYLISQISDSDSDSIKSDLTRNMIEAVKFHRTLKTTMFFV